MTTARPIHQLHDRIVESNEFHLLAPYAEPQTWDALSDEERALLSDLFILKGENELEAGHKDAMDSFEVALKINPTDAQLHYWLGMLYASRSQNGMLLERAEALYARAVEIDPSFIDAWHSWGHTLSTRAELEENQELFDQAEERFSEAAKLVEAKQVDKPELFWDWGRARFMQAQSLDDVSRVRAATEFYEQAATRGLDNTAFWFDFADATFCLGTVLESEALVRESVEHLTRVIDGVPDFPGAWMRMGIVCRRLYEMASQEADFKQADHAFAQASELGGDEGLTWMEWARLYYIGGMIHSDLDYLEVAVDKFSTADLYRSQDLDTLKGWSLSLVSLGLAEERLDRLREAEEKVLRCIEIAKDDLEVWIAYGAVYDALGRYFGDAEYLEQAITGLRHALTLFPEHGLLLQNLGRLYLTLGVQRQDPELLQNADKVFQRAQSCGMPFSSHILDDWGMALMHLADIQGSAEMAVRAVEKLDPHLFEQGEIPAESLAMHLTHYGLALDLLGDLTGGEEHYQRAVEALTQVVQLAPDDSFAHFSLGMALSHLGSLVGDMETLSQALHCFDQAAQIDPDEETVYNEWGLALMHGAHLLDPDLHTDERGTLLSEAESRFAHAAKLGSGQSFYHLAVLYTTCGQFEAAMDLLQRAFKNDGLPPVDEMLEDEWLADLRETGEFQEFIAQMKSGDQA